MNRAADSPQRIEDSAPRPPGYDYETALARHREHEASEESSWKEIEGHAPNSGCTLYAVQPDGSYERVRAYYQHDGTFWSYSQRENDAGVPEKTVEIVSRDDYYRHHIDTPAARGEAVTRYVVPHHYGYVTTSEETARSHAERKNVDWSDVLIKRDVRVLHGKPGAFSGSCWTYWSDEKMTSGLSRDDAGDFSAKGNGEFSEAAEELLTKLWEGGKKSVEHFSAGKQRLARVEEITASESLIEPVSERYGLSSYNFSNHSVELRQIETRHEDGEDAFFLVEEIYAGMSGDGYVNKKYAFFDEEGSARAAYHRAYGTRKTRKIAYERAIRAFSENTAPEHTHYDADGEEIEDTFSLFLQEKEWTTETTYPDVEEPALETAEQRLLFGLNHYLPTGAHFGEGVTYQAAGTLAVVLATSQASDEDALEALQGRLEEAREAGLSPRINTEGKGRSSTRWHELRVPAEEADLLADALLAESGPYGWGPGYELLRKLDLIGEKPTRERKPLWDRSDLHFIGMKGGQAVGSEETRAQMEEMQMYTCALEDRSGNALTWEDVAGKLAGIVDDRKARVDEGTVMADRPAFALAHIEEGRVVRLEVYRGHDRLELDVNLRSAGRSGEVDPTYRE